MKASLNSDKHLPMEDAWLWVRDTFPFKDYIPDARKECYLEMPKAVSRFLPKGASILDYGAGPCDKTAILALIGYKVTAVDDMGDDWYNFGDNRQKIFEFASRSGIDYLPLDHHSPLLIDSLNYDAIVLNNVIEHLHDSPRKLLNRLLMGLNINGFIFIDVPNAANLRKRIEILRGGTNYPAFESFYWSTYPWRGHVREFVRSDLVKLNRFLGLELAQLRSHHYHLERVGPRRRHIFKLICKIIPSFRESWMYIAKKPFDWIPRTEPTNHEAAIAYEKDYFKYEKNMIDWEK